MKQLNFSLLFLILRFKALVLLSKALIIFFFETVAFNAQKNTKSKINIHIIFDKFQEIQQYNELINFIFSVIASWCYHI